LYDFCYQKSTHIFLLVNIVLFKRKPQMDIVKDLGPVENFKKLTQEVALLMIKIGPTKPEKTYQIGLQSPALNNNNWDSGIGQLKTLDDKNEENYIHPNIELAGTEIESLLKKFKGFRARIMVMHSGKAYTVHEDPTPRIHIPIITNKNAWMIWPHNNFCAHLLAGNAYWTDTRLSHTFMNGDPTATRVHIVIPIKNEQT
jgi:hypothetical protein